MSTVAVQLLNGNGCAPGSSAAATLQPGSIVHGEVVLTTGPKGLKLSRKGLSVQLRGLCASVMCAEQPKQKEPKGGKKKSKEAGSPMAKLNGVMNSLVDEVTDQLHTRGEDSGKLKQRATDGANDAFDELVDGMRTQVNVARGRLDAPAAKNRRVYQAGGDVVRVELQLLATVQEEHVLPANQRLVFPFQMQLPANAPPSQQWDLPHLGEQPEDDPTQKSPAFDFARARVQYALSATAFVTGVFSSNLTAKQEVRVAPRLAVGPPPGSLMASNQHGDVSFPKMSACSCFGSHEVLAHASVAKRAFQREEMLTVQAHVDNRSNVLVDQVTLALQTVLTLHVRGHSLTRPVTVARHVHSVRIDGGRESDVTLQLVPDAQAHSLLSLADTHCAAFSTRTELLVHVHMRGVKHAAQLRFPLSPVYELAAAPTMPQQSQPPQSVVTHRTMAYDTTASVPVAAAGAGAGYVAAGAPFVGNNSAYAPLQANPQALPAYAAEGYQAIAQ